MWTAGMCAQFLAFLCMLALVCRVGHGLDIGWINFSKVILMSLRTSMEGVVPTNISAELFVLYHSDKRTPPWPLRRKRGRRGGVHCKMKTFCLDNRCQLPRLPFLSYPTCNLQGLKWLMEIWAKFDQEIKESCLLTITETCLDENDLDSDFALTGFGCAIRLDVSSEVTGKSPGGVCFYVKEQYCKNIIVMEKICTPDRELLSISLCPFYLPQEFPQLFFTFVHSPNG